MGAPISGYTSNDDKTWALVAHFGGAAGALVGGGAGGWVAPLIAMLAKGESPTVRRHAVDALNFQILISIIAIIGWITVCILIGWFVVLAAMALGVIFGIMAGLKANESSAPYKYPFTISVVK